MQKLAEFNRILQNLVETCCFVKFCPILYRFISFFSMQFLWQPLDWKKIFFLLTYGLPSATRKVELNSEQHYFLLGNHDCVAQIGVYLEPREKWNSKSDSRKFAFQNSGSVLRTSQSCSQKVQLTSTIHINQKTWLVWNRFDQIY